MVVNVKVQFISISTKVDICLARYLSVKCSLQNASMPFKKILLVWTANVSREKSEHDRDNLGMTSLNSFSKFL